MIYIGILFLGILSSGNCQSVTIYADVNFNGESREISLFGGNCENTLGDWNDRTSSIRLNANCVELFEHINCGGRSIKLTRNSAHLDNFVELNFNDQMTSLKSCSGDGGGDGGSGLCVAEHNAARAKHGLPPYGYDEKLARASQVHTERVARENCENPHQCPGEKGFGDRFREQGYPYSGYGGENFMAGSGNCKDAVEGWMGSKGHRENILRDYKQMGCGRKDNLWTCGFANPK